MKYLKLLVLCFLFIPLVVGAETASWDPPLTWQDGSIVSAQDLATYTYYLRIWRGTDPTVVPSNPADIFYLGETRNGITTWTDNILVKANQRVTPPLAPGDKVIVSVSTAFNDGTKELDSWTDQKPGLAAAYTIPGAEPPPPPPPPPVTRGCNPPRNLSIR